MPHISYSELKDWSTCPYLHKVTWIDKIGKFEGNIYTTFGSALHSVCEEAVQNQETKVSVLQETFERKFLENIIGLPPVIRDKLSDKMVEEFSGQGREIVPHILPELRKVFGEYEVISVEERLDVGIDGFEEDGYTFKGFIDLVIRTSDGKYHIVDWKSCLYGWDMKKRQDKMTVYQLVLYKYFYSKKHGIDLKDIDIHFALLKRTSKGDKVEVFRTTSGDRRIQNAMNLLNKAVVNILRGIKIKNRLNCTRGYGCPLNKTEHCR